MKIFSFMEAFKIIMPDESYRDALVKDMNTESSENQYEIKKIIWSAFWDLFNSQVSLKMKEKIEKENTINQSVALRQSRKEIWTEFEDILSGKKGEMDEMKEIRTKLQQLILESRSASK